MQREALNSKQKGIRNEAMKCISKSKKEENTVKQHHKPKKKKFEKPLALCADKSISHDTTIVYMLTYGIDALSRATLSVHCRLYYSIKNINDIPKSS